MKSFFSIGSKQTDMEIFKYVDDRDILSLCLVNKSANKILNDDTYWLQRFFYFYQKYFKDVNYKEYKTEKSWKQYYIDITKRIKFPFPYYASAIAFSERRFDVLSLLENFYNIKRVKGVAVRKGDNIVCYYTRNGKFDGIKEGLCLKVKLPEINNKTDLSYHIVSKFPDRIEEYYNAGVIEHSLQFINNIKVSESIYENGDLSKLTKWNKKGVKIYEETYNGIKCNITKWFVSGDMKSETHYDDGKKDGIWYRWNKNGEKFTKYFRDGKAVEYIPTAEESAADDLYIAEMEKQVELQKKNRIF